MNPKEQWNQQLLAAITSSQAQLLGKIQASPLFEQLLDALLQLTASEYGFIAEVVFPETGTPFLRSRAITNIAWNGVTRRFYAENASEGLEFTKLESLFGAVLTSESPVIANSPDSDRRRGGLPKGHPRLDAFLGLPLHNAGSLVGVMGVANRKGGYDEALVNQLAPFVWTCATSVSAVSAESKRKSIEEKLRYERLRMQVMLDGIVDAVISTDEAGVIDSINSSAERIFGYGEAELRGEKAALILGQATHPQFNHFLRTYGTPDEPIVFGRAHEVVGRRKSGEEFPMEVTIAEVESGGMHFFTAICRDLSETNRAKKQIDSLRSELERRRFGNMVGRSTSMRRLYESIEEIAAGESSVLIEGETGVGKELVARALHAASSRSRGPFITTSLSGHADALIESQLFGHSQRAFADATPEQQGLFEAAAGGTLFIDEIGDISEVIQAAFLRTLEQHVIVRLGETTPRKLNVRIIAATNRNLEQPVDGRSFRKDLLHRLRAARINVPALRDRGDDIALLAETFLAEARATTGKAIIRFSHDVTRRMLAYDWPGNVRELRNLVNYASVRCKGSAIQLGDLPPEFCLDPQGKTESSQLAPTPDQERERIGKALKQTGGNRTHAARLLGISRATLYRRLDALGIGPS